MIAVNKWDAVDDYQRQLLERSIESRLSFLKFASLHFISAKKGKVFIPLGVYCPSVQGSQLQDADSGTTRLLLEAVQFQSPQRAGMFRPKLCYAHQGGMNPQ